MDKIYRRSTQLGNTPKKKKNERNRKRYVILNFRVTPEEKALIYKRAEISGLSKSAYLIESCMYQTILVKGNVKLFERIRKEINDLKNIVQGKCENRSVTPEELEALKLILEILEKAERIGDRN